MSNLDIIKNLRQISGAGFLDCKTALDENDNDIEKSLLYLRKKGLSKVLKKSSRDANEGVVGVFRKSNRVVLLEINTETDFAAKNDIFLDFVEQIADFALTDNLPKELKLEDFLDKTFEDRKILEYFNDIITKIGENIVLKKFFIYSENQGEKIFTYTHNAYRKNIGKISVVLKANHEKEDENLDIFGKNLCMHIAAMKPMSLDIQDLNSDIIEKEKEVLVENIKSSGKPSNIVEKILEGKLNKFYSEVTLLNQAFILDTDKTVKKTIHDFSLDNKFSIIDFSYLVLGND